VNSPITAHNKIEREWEKHNSNTEKKEKNKA